MIGLDLGQHQRSMDVLLHRQRLVRDVLWCNMSIIYVWEAYIWVDSYLINLSNARSNVPFEEKKEQ
jgi:hypothetical protein